MNKTFSATLSNLKNIRLFVTNFLNDYELEIKLVNNIKLAVDESVSNIIKHGYKGEDENNKIEIKLELIKKKLSIHLFDNGTPVNQKNIQPRNLKDIKPGGLGSYFINEIMDEVKWETKSKDWVNHLILIKTIYWITYDCANWGFDCWITFNSISTYFQYGSSCKIKKRRYLHSAFILILSNIIKTNYEALAIVCTNTASPTSCWTVQSPSSAQKIVILPSASGAVVASATARI